ncbi:MAG: hypothetical protein QOI78_1505, partial [Actinomycetota bacterium]|nr:hypothetical protein [Actinomycetota bacterium]
MSGDESVFIGSELGESESPW